MPPARRGASRDPRIAREAAQRRGRHRGRPHAGRQPWTAMNHPDGETAGRLSESRLPRL